MLTGMIFFLVLLQIDFRIHIWISIWIVLLQQRPSVNGREIYTTDTLTTKVLQFLLKEILKQNRISIIEEKLNADAIKTLCFLSNPKQMTHNFVGFFFSVLVFK